MCSEHLFSKNNDILPFSFQQWNESEWWKKVIYLQQGGEIIKILCCVALVYNSYFFSEQAFSRGNYSTLDSHTNAVISHVVAYSSRWLPKPWQGL